MNVLVAVAIAPFGVGDELADEVSQAVRVIRESGLSYKVGSMFTEIEGEWDAVMAVVKEATFALAEKGIRTEVVLKADLRPGFTDTMHSKVAKVRGILGDDLHA
ncbi:thiamine-binding protein [Adlercreutzia murintestinalis]|uniref:thiamine-binding protein n=1 Tax=Adlercreutzia murintestinalis TaxID=2941325 RepID=UPI00203E1BBA|nr:thiamine-binding protein [Adlercreutzia murintestinalis]